MTAIALTIAGSDSGGGAGIQADLKTFSALGVYGASVLTALTAQNTHGVSAIHDVPPAFVRAQMDAVLGDLAVNAVKIGMLSQPDVIRAVAEGLDAHGMQAVVLDPVMVAASGDPLLVPEAVAVIIEHLLPRAALITPNLPEAARMLETSVAEGREAMRDQAQALLRLGARAVLLKGGHGGGPASEDCLLTGDGAETWLSAPRHETRNTHGTGCTLSSAITAGLARGLPLAEAVAAGKAYVTAAIRSSDRLTIGSGHGPVHHFHAFWGASA
ncbi:bifunctional hydroxymethylpyrimidine kinase/phosphomethylpyrimidine kinase [Microvirga tunisiensis]|uniref:hydroxymethylpyrimidine kinase n=2 Tax=Pannonibacter tanglangensis TaxID=2750084 RepID=A0A7X5J7T9_9HYPH|nr:MULTISPECIES: bifunctional hydroxymethylpyrimidine kinase/phosphomethylpyrimidine kinase [unclassified Pannonibacter]NBN63490.1 bifunctional hydroxymethylpyrimidine kinase/phosphomethylpyrimidine kinase [Pannonibacter sp. XCT-34]NBN77127.1 bifunctional hydroxymethylpyrimidine kinase/phosphomethylpyrimidine kinase [Pannonibacter sp. XCT-53]